MIRSRKRNGVVTGMVSRPFGVAMHLLLDPLLDPPHVWKELSTDNSFHTSWHWFNGSINHFLINLIVPAGNDDKLGLVDTQHKLTMHQLL